LPNSPTKFNPIKQQSLHRNNKHNTRGLKK